MGQMSADALPSSWIPIQSFPAADGSRTLRASVPTEVVDSIHGLELSGVRHTVFRNKNRKFLSKTEVRDSTTSTWCDLGTWLRGRERRRALQAKRIPPRLPAVVFEELRKGNLKAVTQSCAPDVHAAAGSGHISTLVEVELSDGSFLPLSDWLKRETTEVEMCLPLSKDEALALFEEDSIMGVRHSYAVDYESDTQQHIVEVSSIGEVWAVLPPNTIISWDSIVEPHFRLTFANKLSVNRTRQVVYSSDPWVA